LDAHRPHPGNDPGEAVAPVPLQRLGLATRPPATRPGDGRYGLHHRLKHLFLALVGRADAHYQRQPVGVRDDVAFTAFFAAIRGVGAGVRPPFTARSEAQSMTARSRLISPRRPSALRSWWWALRQTPAVVH